MLRRLTHRLALTILAFLVLLPGAILYQPQTAQAAASLYVSGAGSVKVGDTVTINIMVSTGGQSANAFEANFSYPSSLFDGVRGSFSGSVCAAMPVAVPDPSGGTASFSCGTPSGFTGTAMVATIVLSAKAAGSGSFGLSSCSVLANDGQGTDITGGCSGTSVTVSQPAASTPTPNAPSGSIGGNTSTGSTATPKGTATPKTSSTPKPAESAKATPTPTAEPTPPPAQPLSSSAPEAVSTSNPENTPQSGEETAETSATEENTTERRTIAQAFGDLFGSFKDLGSIGKNSAGVVAIFVTLIPVLGLSCAILFMVYRLYILERRRRRTLDRLFEMELSELAALEGKLDLLAEKGAKGREQYREEFEKVKQNILRQLRPDYNKPVEGAKNKLDQIAEKAEDKIADPKK